MAEASGFRGGSGGVRDSYGSRPADSQFPGGNRGYEGYGNRVNGGEINGRGPRGELGAGSGVRDDAVAAAYHGWSGRKRSFDSFDGESEMSRGAPRKVIAQYFRTIEIIERAQEIVSSYVPAGMPCFFKSHACGELMLKCTRFFWGCTFTCVVDANIASLHEKVGSHLRA